MSPRSPVFALAAALAVALSGCFDDASQERGLGDNEIVFGINQIKSSDGKVTASVGYEMLDLANHGWTARGIITDERRCWAERLDDRLGQPRVAGGVATFQGGALPSGGVAVVANRGEDLTLPGPAWTKGGEELTFEAKGFAMPDIRASKLVVPAVDLAVTAPASATDEVRVAADQDLEIAWTPGENGLVAENVVASLTAVPQATPNARGVELRCFFDRSAGRGALPKSVLDRFVALVSNAPGTPIKGKLHIATHRQLTIFADGGWTVYVVATADQREQPLLLQR